MKIARCAACLLTLLLVLASAGCGNKGDLVRPGPRPATVAGG